MHSGASFETYIIRNIHHSQLLGVGALLVVICDEVANLWRRQHPPSITVATLYLTRGAAPSTIVPKKLRSNAAQHTSQSSGHDAMDAKYCCQVSTAYSLREDEQLTRVYEQLVAV